MNRYIIDVICVGVIALTLSGCAFNSEGSRNSLWSGDADFALFANRTSKAATKNTDSNSNGVTNSSVAEPNGGGSISLGAESLSNIASVASALVPAVMREAALKDAAVCPSATPRVFVVKAVPRTYVVENGDCLSTIAREHGTTVKSLKKANGLKSDKIKVGTVLRLP